MTPIEIQDFRIARLQELLEKKFDGKKVELGRALGHKSGAFVRQMLERERPITEKTVASIHELPGCAGWMDAPAESESARPSRRPTHAHELSVCYGSNTRGKAQLMNSMVVFAALAKERVDAPQRKVLAQLVGSLFDDGPADPTAKAIDALTPQLDGFVASGTEHELAELDQLRRWQAAIFSMAEHEPPPERAVIARFLVKVQHALAEQAEATKASREAKPASPPTKVR